MKAFEHAVAAIIGDRNNQEDSAAFWPGGDNPLISTSGLPLPSDESCIAVLADGMGGHTGGALASRIVCEHFLLAAAQQTHGASKGLGEALEAANAALASKISDSPMLAGMGSTIIGALFSPAGLQWVSVGDSPLYLFRDGDVRILNEDHSLAPELDRLVSLGRMTESEARKDSRRHMLRSAVTGDDIDLIDITSEPFPLLSGDYIVLASDGVCSLRPDEVARTISGCHAEGAGAVAKALIRAVSAKRAPGQDNATVIVVRPLAVSQVTGTPQ